MSDRLRYPASHSETSRPAASGPASGPRAGFSLIELLTVIAIISILAAVIFPIVGVVRGRASQSQVIANLHSIQAAINLYKQDEHSYPATLGPVECVDRNGRTYSYGGLFPEHLKDQGAYRSPANDLDEVDRGYRVNNNASAQMGYLAIPSAVAMVRDPTMRDECMAPGWNTMDGHVEPKDGPVDQRQYIRHYSLFRVARPEDDPANYKRQLGLRNPPEDTVITWNDTFVRKNEAGEAISGDYLVLFLNGTVKRYSVDRISKLVSRPGDIWKVKPF